jgi:hypothetical protein
MWKTSGWEAVEAFDKAEKFPKPRLFILRLRSLWKKRLRAWVYSWADAF